MIEFSEHEVLSYFRARVPDLRLIQGKLRGPCPIHQGKDPNFGVEMDSGRWFCHSQCNRGGDIISLEMEISAVDFVKAKAEVFQITGRPKDNYQDRDVEASYDYTDENGAVIYQVVRKSGKKFMQRRPVPNHPGQWNWGLGDTKPVPFRLSDVMRSDVVAICEGEKDCINLVRAGWVATCNNGGAGNFKPSLAPYFAGKHVAIFPDNDEPGRKHAEAVAGLLSPVAASVRVVEMPDLPLKGDVSDYLASGKTGADLRALARGTQVWSPEFKFDTEVPHENDRYLRTFGQSVSEAGGYEKFWKSLEVEGIATPFESLTRKLGGLRNGEVYVIGANQGAGKTSLALQFIIAAVEKRHGVLMFSMEMGHRDVFQRMAGIDGRVDLSEYRKLRRNPSEDPALLRAYEASLRESTAKFERSPLYVTTKTGVTPEFLTAEVQRVKESAKIDLVVVDHMQLMSATGRVKSDYEKFTAISRETKGIAMELGVPLILVSQTSRSNSSDKRAELEVSDLRGSGAIEEDAAGVMLLYYDAEDFKNAKMEPDRLKRGPIRTWLKLGKNRFGPQGTYEELEHFKALTRFDQVAAHRQREAE